jgi:hypothetical protein
MIASTATLMSCRERNMIAYAISPSVGATNLRSAQGVKDGHGSSETWMKSFDRRWILSTPLLTQSRTT